MEPWACGQGDPCFQHLRGIHIRMGLQTAVTTTKHFLARSVGAFGMRTPTALLRGVDVAFAVGCDVDETQVDADNATRRKGYSFLDGDGTRQVEDAVAQKKVGLSLPVLQTGFLFRGAKEREVLPSLHGVEADRLRLHLPRQQVPVEFDGTERLEGTQGVPVALVSMRHFGNRSDNVVGVEAGFSFDMVVGQGM